MRGVFFAEEKNEISQYVDLVFQSYWTSNLDISSDEVLIQLVDELGWNTEQFLIYIAQDSVKEALRLNTEELAERGGFGSPTMFIDEDNMFFGNDRLKLIEELLAR